MEADKVSLVKFGGDLHQTLSLGLHLISFQVPSDRPILIKPNLCAEKDKTGAQYLASVGRAMGPMETRDPGCRVNRCSEDSITMPGQASPVSRGIDPPCSRASNTPCCQLIDAPS